MGNNYIRTVLERFADLGIIISEEELTSKYRGKRAAIDALWVLRTLLAVAENDSFEEIESLVGRFLVRVIDECGIRPLMIFDGRPIDGKSEVAHVQREKRRTDNDEEVLYLDKEIADRKRAKRDVLLTDRPSQEMQSTEKRVSGTPDVAVEGKDFEETQGSSIQDVSVERSDQLKDTSTVRDDSDPKSQASFPVGDVVVTAIRPVSKNKTLEELEQRQSKLIVANRRVLPHHKEAFRSACLVRGVECARAPTEGEKMCSFLCAIGVVDLVISDDWDCLAFGSPVTIRHFSGTRFPTTEVDLCRVLEKLELDMQSFVDLFILCGCDTAKGIPGMGGITAYRLIRQHRSIEKLLEKEPRWKEKASVIHFPYKRARLGFTDFSEESEALSSVPSIEASK